MNKVLWEQALTERLMRNPDIRKWLESFLKSTNVKFKISGSNITLYDDIHQVDLQWTGGTITD